MHVYCTDASTGCQLARFSPCRSCATKTSDSAHLRPYRHRIDRGLLEGPDQKVAPLLRDKLPADPDPRLHGITIGNLLSMQAGLQRTSGPSYGRWVASRDWVRAALEQPFVGEPGGGMLYSTGNSHPLSAILTRIGGRSTLALAHDWLAPLEEFAIADWMATRRASTSAATRWR